jgi:hypothetical protein
MNRLIYSRLLLLGLTLLDLSVMIGCGLAMQSHLLAIKALSVAVLFIAALGIILLSREWVNSSTLTREEGYVTIRWNNWEMKGNLLDAKISNKRPKRLELTVKDPEVLLYPVGPMFILAGLLFKPWLVWFPSILKECYYYRKDKLLADASFDEGKIKVGIPLIFIGKRKAKKWLG